MAFKDIRIDKMTADDITYEKEQGADRLIYAPPIAPRDDIEAFMEKRNSVSGGNIEISYSFSVNLSDFNAEETEGMVHRLSNGVVFIVMNADELDIAADRFSELRERGINPFVVINDISNLNLRDNRLFEIVNGGTTLVTEASSFKEKVSKKNALRIIQHNLSSVFVTGRPSEIKASDFRKALASRYGDDFLPRCDKVFENCLNRIKPKEYEPIRFSKFDLF